MGSSHPTLHVVDTEELFPVASATTFFTDMHHVLKVMAVGNVRSYCHHRLRFLEEVTGLAILFNFPPFCPILLLLHVILILYHLLVLFFFFISFS